MKLPIGIIARFALNHIALPAIAKAITSDKVPLTKESAKHALEQAVQDEVWRQVAKRAR
jgi:hypothetical protein